MKDGINDYIVHGARETVNPSPTGTKAAAHYVLEVPARASTTIRLRLTDLPPEASGVGADFDAVFTARLHEADEFYATVIPTGLSADAALVMRQSLAGMLWSKQFYHYVVKEWLEGDPGQPPPPPERQNGRNHDWGQLYNADVISMPDKWEYPWYEIGRE